MENAVKNRLQSVQFAEPQTYKNITILPLIAPADGTFLYRTLGEALATWDIAITEVSAAGSVPDLMVVNRANTPVLLLDGEELAGAKQNRVLNTSILIKGVSETKIPVSCTEQGRWSYASQAFSESGHVMTRKSRARKSRSVSHSLETLGAPKSDQGIVWQDIEQLQVHACAPSPTSAMSDVYKAREDDLRQCDEVFKPVANQIGLMAFIAGQPAGLDLVSLTVAYTKLHPKLVRSYALEAILEHRPSPKHAGEGGAPAPGEGKSASQPSTLNPQLLSAAQSFFAEILAAEEHQFPSVGHGTDYRYRTHATQAPGPKPISASRLTALQHFTLAGSALVHANEVIHAAFFRLDEQEQQSTMAPLRNRRRHYRE